MILRFRQPHAGVLVLRLAGARSAERLLVANEIFTSYLQALSGNFSVYQKGHLGILQTSAPELVLECSKPADPRPSPPTA